LILTVSVIVSNQEGLHARPAAELVKLVETSNHKVFISNKAGKRVSGSSLLGILSLGVQTGDPIELEVDGPAAQEILEQIKAVVAS